MFTFADGCKYVYRKVKFVNAQTVLEKCYNSLYLVTPGSTTSSPQNISRDGHRQLNWPEEVKRKALILRGSASLYLQVVYEVLRGSSSK
jgi:hypothetical protein